jgi:hypothetical protein
LHFFEGAGLLDAAQAGQDGVEEIQQDEGAVVVEEQRAIAGAVSLSCRAAAPRNHENGRQSGEQTIRPVAYFQSSPHAAARHPEIMKKGFSPATMALTFLPRKKVGISLVP